MKVVQILVEFLKKRPQYRVQSQESIVIFPGSRVFLFLSVERDMFFLYSNHKYKNNVWFLD